MGEQCSSPKFCCFSPRRSCNVRPSGRPMNGRRIAYFVRSMTPDSLLRGMARAGQFLGAGLPGDATFPSIYRSLKVLSRLGFSPMSCIDVGAYHGEWTKIFKSVFPRSRVLMIEAQEGKRSVLQGVAISFDPDVTMEIALLGPTDGTSVEFHEMETGSSVFAESSPYQRRTVTRATRTLDAVMSAESRPSADFLKLDVQGYELEVLKGAARVLTQVEAVLLEVSLLAINAGCPTFAEVVAFLDRAGFELFDFCSQVRRNDGVLWQTDLLFLRRGSRFAPDARLTKDNWG
jgi:FkbM family methyltransferase